MNDPLYEMIDGERVEMSPEAEAAIVAEWAANASAPRPPRIVTPFQFKTALAQLGIISESEVASPNLPAVAEAAISALPLEDRIKARSRWANMTSAPEDDALLVAMCLAAELPLETIGQVFDLAVTIT